MNDVREKLLQLKDRGWTMAAIADELDVSHMTVFRWRKGMRNGTILADGLDIPRKQRC